MTKRRILDKKLLDKFTTKQQLGKAVIDIITELQDELTRQDPEAHKNKKGEKFRSPFVHAETLKGLVMELFQMEDGR